MRDVVHTLRRLPGWLRVLMIGQFVSAAGSLAWLYMTLYLVVDRGMSVPTAGLVTAAYGVGVIAGNLGGGWIGDRFGLRRTMLIAVGGWVVCCALVPITPVAALPVLIAVAGAIGGINRPVGSALVATAIPAELRRVGIALSRSVSNAGTIVGPPLGALFAAYDFGLLFVFDAVTSAILWVVIFSRVPRPAVATGAFRPRGGLIEALRARPAILALLAAIVAIDSVYRLQYTVLPLWLRDHGQPTAAYGLLISLNCVLIVLAEAALAVRLHGHSAVAVIGVGFLLVGAGYLLLGTGLGLIAAVAMMIVVTAGEMLYKPTATAYAADAAPDGMAGRYQSLYGAASIAGMTLSPALGTALYAHSPALVWPVGGLLALAVGAGTLAVGRPRPIPGPRPVPAPDPDLAQHPS
ncbi:MAG: MFS transporter [Hamadaea sp.]|nr:MFS transporter [Hamadaea sp.]